MRLTLRQGVKAAPERTAAMVHGRGVAPRRFNIERLKLTPVAASAEKSTMTGRKDQEEREAVLA